MVRYCVAYGCGSNSKSAKNLSFHRLPKRERHRQEEWLKLCGRQDILSKANRSKGGKIWELYLCSRHFTPNDFVYKAPVLKADSKPSLFLAPADKKEKIVFSDEEAENAHEDVVCNSCEQLVKGFRYKCVTCPDYDLCHWCERRAEHTEHFMLRVPKNLEFASLEKVIKKWRKCFEEVHGADGSSDSSDDDLPITQYKNYDSGVDLSEDVKDSIRKEVKRVLSLKPEELEKRSRKFANAKKKELRKRTHKNGNADGNQDNLPSNKRCKVETEQNLNTNVAALYNNDANVAVSKNNGANVAFADVDSVETKAENSTAGDLMRASSSSQDARIVPILNDVTLLPQGPMLPVQDGNPPLGATVSTSTYPDAPVLPADGDQRPVMHVKLSDDFTELMVEVTSNNQKTFYKI